MTVADHGRQASFGIGHTTRWITHEPAIAVEIEPGRDAGPARRQIKSVFAIHQRHPHAETIAQITEQPRPRVRAGRPGDFDHGSFAMFKQPQQRAPFRRDFIDTPGAYPGVGAEERGQAEAIAKSIECCMELKVPTISVIIGEGGSGGAIALASSNKVLMFENAIYSVISPEGCATILWRDPKKTLEAAEAMKLSSKNLLGLGVIDEVISEPTGGAHRDKDICLINVRESIRKNLEEMKLMSRDEILSHRKNKFLSIGRSKGFASTLETDKNLTMKKNPLQEILLKVKKFRFHFIIVFCLLIFGLIYYLL